MPSYLSGPLIKMLRLRKKMNRHDMTKRKDSNISEMTLLRIEHNKNKANPHTMQHIVDALPLMTETVLYPRLESQRCDIYNLRENLFHYMDNTDAERIDFAYIEEILNSLAKQEDFKQGINRQFILCCKAQMYEMKGMDASKILPLIKEALLITELPFFEAGIQGEALLFEEVNLLHILARVYSRTGKMEESINLLHEICERVESLPEDDREKDKKLAGTLLTLSDLLTKETRYEEALRIIAKGEEVNLHRLHGRYAPDFAYLKALCLHGLKQFDECRFCVYMAYFGYMLLHKRNHAEKVRTGALNRMGVTVETYGVDLLSFSEQDLFKRFNSGNVPAFDSIGHLIKLLRKEANLSMGELCNGLCSVSTLSRIEHDTFTVDIQLLEVLMQRLGRDIDSYFNTFLSEQEFNNKQLRDKINYLLPRGRYDEAEALLPALEQNKDYQTGIGFQFVLLTKATLIWNKEDRKEEYIKLLHQALVITMPNFNEQLMPNGRLSYYEIVILNQMAMYWCDNGNINLGLTLFDRLVKNMDDFYIDEYEKIKMYGTIIYNYSKHLGMDNQFQKALFFIDKAETIDIKHGRLTSLPQLAINKGCDISELYSKDRGLPYFAMAFYGSALINEKNNQRLTRLYVMEHYGIDLF